MQTNQNHSEQKEGTLVKQRVCLAALCLLLGLSACGGAQSTQTAPAEGLDKLGEITVVAREDGSGTRGAVAELVGIVNEQANAAQSDLTREDAQIADNAEAVLDLIGQDSAAIGYVSRAAVDSADGVKAVSINGSAIDDKAYPLRRSFYLAYTGTQSELQEDFLRYVRTAGQEIVGENYLAVAKNSSFLSNRAAGTLTITGSTSVAPLMEQLAEAYRKYNPNAEISITETDSTDGLNQAMSGSCNLGMSSRDLKDYEAELLDCEIIAQDDIAVVVNADNPMENLSIDQLRSILTGETARWQDCG